ncbi:MULTISPECIES: ParB/RepB/Spo0J family plasmid partition protein [Enterobacter]|jgi:ParB family chromosome partitioning protein|uniref:ParB/RepB/Spo0J family plasmid partition protein n=1 Tax=Enterobacter TaxID=547 RepID=UPI00163A2DE0|nr:MULTISPECIES: ParB/RepB/Spo0J family plasmid partition protein [Enterobacter]MBK1520815.1 ParB/RepB/Spo0J family plasmid partition protein [Enterobacter ludwigii]MDR6368707.1 ParB family chromosome partitioning protein [Enterobacter sp. SORGH_AS_0287]
MKRAPVIRKTTVPAATPVETEQAPAAPMVDSLIARVGAMARGNSIVIPVCGRDVKFTLETVPGNSVESATRVWAGNERDQDLLTEESLDDLIPSFLLTGQQNPAFGRRVAEGIEVADGSRRRKTAILTSSDYRVLVGDLDDEQMDALCKLGNDYRPTSAYERGKRYAARLADEFGGNISALAEAENISRKIISRCMNTAKLPKELIALFSHPGELSARAGEALHKSFSEKEDLLLQQVRQLADRKTAGVIFEADEVIQLLNGALTRDPVRRSALSTKKQIVKGATAIYKGDKVVFQLDRSLLPAQVIDQIEALLSKLKD